MNSFGMYKSFIFVESYRKNVRSRYMQYWLSRCRYLTQYPHPAGQPVSKKQADHLKKLWTEQGLDKVDIHKYNILLSYPNNPGQITIFEDGKEIKKLVIDNEPAIDDTEKKGEVLYPFNAFSPNATVTVSVSF